MSTDTFNLFPNFPAVCRLIGENIAHEASTPRNVNKLIACLVLPGTGGFWTLTENMRGKRTLWCKNEFNQNVRWVEGMYADEGYDARVAESAAFVRWNPTSNSWDEWESHDTKAAREQADAENTAKLAAKKEG